MDSVHFYAVYILSSRSSVETDNMLVKACGENRDITLQNQPTVIASACNIVSSLITWEAIK